jgi:alkanesulfonate monooxygenase SsuD/methylene tetrahydromethanopterin reductase-like flavin-dependent oxidoreductase (luciferase family)/predicted kinase
VTDAVVLPAPCLVVLVGPGAAGKSTWAAAHFPPDAVVSSDGLRALVGAGEDDVTASTDAFALLDEIVALRAARRLTTVVDTLGLDAERRAAWRDLARRSGLPCVAVSFDTPTAVCRARNRARDKRIPVDVLAAQLRAWPAVRDGLPAEGFDRVVDGQAAEPVRVVAAPFAASAPAAARQRDQPTGLRFALHLSEYAAPGGAPATREWLRQVAAGAEAAGLDGIYLMDHLRQIPQVGRAWDDMLESWTTLAFLAACTERVRLGTLVTGVTLRQVAHLGKVVATLDVLSGGRAVCGLGLGWFAEENRALGIPFPDVPARYALLEDALRLLPVLWGPGSPPFHGQVLEVPETLCYPRPLQEHVPMLVGGGGEAHTLRLAARYADAANVMGPLDTVRRKATVLRAHCVDAGRDPDAVGLTHLSTVLVGDDDRHVAELVRARRPRRRTAEQFAASVNAGTVADHVGRFRELAEAGVTEVMVRLPDLADLTAIERLGRVVAEFR